MKRKIILWAGLFLGLALSSLWGKEKNISVSLVQIKGIKRKGATKKKPKIDKKLKSKKYKTILKNLLENYFYQQYILLGDETQKAAWDETILFKLKNKMILQVTPQKKLKKQKWIYLKILIQCPLPNKNKKKVKPIKYKKVVALVQKLKSGATFLVRLKIKGGVLFLALHALDKKTKGKS